MKRAIGLVVAWGIVLSSSTVFAGPYDDGLKIFKQVFGELRQSFQTVIVEPEARAQAARYLRRLSSRLGDVAIEKQQLTHDLISSTLPRDRAKLDRQIETLQSAIEDLQFSLQDFFQAMPSSWQIKGGALKRALEQVLGGKWERLQGMSQHFGNSSTAPGDVVTESRQIEEMLEGAQAAVDAPINDLSSGGT